VYWLAALASHDAAEAASARGYYVVRQFVGRAAIAHGPVPSH
jgi:hypothetical protein